MAKRRGKKNAAAKAARPESVAVPRVDGPELADIVSTKHESIFFSYNITWKIRILDLSSYFISSSLGVVYLSLSCLRSHGPSSLESRRTRREIYANH